MKQPVLVWFRDNLRLKDHEALVEACKTGAPVIALYILDDETPGKWKRGAASRWWLHHSLASLSESLHKAGSRLCLFRGDPLEVLPRLVHKTKATAVYWNRSYEPYALALDKKLAEKLPDTHIFKGSLLFEPWEVLNGQKEPFKVYTPFWKQCLKIDSIEKPLPAPSHIPTHSMEAETLASFQLLPRHPNWAGGLERHWQIGEAAAASKLKRFLTHSLSAYAHDRDLPAVDGTTSLSPHLHFGEISARQIYAEAKPHKQSAKFLSEVGWREFTHYQLYYFPKLPDHPWRAPFASFPWEKNRAAFTRWQKGETGYPIVDAGMRQLWKIGWMHNRVRMIVASFLIKDLFIPWQDGQAWFWDTLVDADLANNAANWQWVAGCGFDASPFFRIFNPVLQGKKFDPDGEYVKQWIPELASVPNQYIHTPWLYDKKLSYPAPVVDHDAARKKALAAFKRIK